MLKNLHRVYVPLSGLLAPDNGFYYARVPWVGLCTIMWNLFWPPVCPGYSFLARVCLGIRSGSYGCRFWILFVKEYVTSNSASLYRNIYALHVMASCLNAKLLLGLCVHERQLKTDSPCQRIIKHSSIYKLACSFKSSRILINFLRALRESFHLLQWILAL